MYAVVVMILKIYFFENTRHKAQISELQFGSSLFAGIHGSIGG